MPQAFYNLLDVLQNDAEWSADHNQNVDLLNNMFRTIRIGTVTAGNISTPSVISLELQKADGSGVPDAPIYGYFYVRVQLAKHNNYGTSGHHATVAVTSGTLVQIITAGKDIVVRSNSSGYILLTITDGTAETFDVLLGPPPTESSGLINYNNGLAVTHA